MTDDPAAEPADDAAEPADDAAEAGEAIPPAETVSTRPAPRQRHRRAAALIGVLTALLGFGIAVQVQSNSSADSLSTAREDDLIRILDDQDSRSDRLTQQIGDLASLEQQLKAGGDKDAVARQQAQQESQDLAILLGTVAATGPGVSVRITDPAHGLKAADLLDVVEELRGAGAEAIQFGPVRVGTSTNFTDVSSGVSVDGQVLGAPYTVLAIGDATTLDTALNIPGGVAAVARSAGGDAVVQELTRVTISALRSVPNPRYATPTSR